MTNHCLMFHRILTDSVFIKYFCIDTAKIKQIEVRRGGFFKDCSNKIYKDGFIKFLPETAVSTSTDSFHNNANYEYDSSLHIGAYISKGYYTVKIYTLYPIGKALDIYFKRKEKNWVYYKREVGEL